MSRRVIKYIALVCVLVLALTGCNLIRVDEEKDKATVVATFNGGTLTKGEVEPEYLYEKEYYAQLSQMYGFEINTDGLLENIAESMVAQKLLGIKGAEMGLDTFTDEEIAEMTATAEADYEAMIQNYMPGYQQDGMTEEQVRAEVVSFFDESNYTVDELVRYAKEQAVIDRLKEQVASGVTLQAADAQNEYDSRVAADQAQYADSATFTDAATNGVTIYCYPEGYRTVKHILLSFTEEQQSAMYDLETEIAAVENDIASYEGLDAAATVGESDITNGEMLESLNAQLADLQAEKAANLTAFTAELQPTINEIYAKIVEHADFNDLIAEYGSDPGMEAGTVTENGYYVSDATVSFVAEFKDAAMALKKVGAISAPVASSYGVHIMRYESDVPAGPVDFETVREDIETELLTAKQDEAYNAQIAAWVEEANVKYDLKSITK